MTTIANILVATILVSLVSLAGASFLYMQEETMRRASVFLVAFASGCLVGAAFFHLVPEAVALGGEGAFAVLVVGVLSFFVLEKFLCWRHCHDAKCEVHSFTYLNLIGDGIHNFLDGIIIAAGFVASRELGMITTAVVIFHEVPQELGEFGVLIYGGFSRKRALALNLLSGLTAVLGGVVGYLFVVHVGRVQPLLLAFAAGAFIYIALADLVPELHQQRRPRESIVQLGLMLVGAVLLWGARYLTHPR